MAKDKRRSIQTKIWSDPWVESLNPKQKLLWIYLLTNSHTNLLGVYEISIKRICFETELKKEAVKNAFEGFESVKKAYYKNNHVIIPNFIPNQEMNNNMWKAAIAKFNELPKSIKNIYKEKALKGFERLKNICEAFEKYEIESESESESEEKKGEEGKEDEEDEQKTEDSDKDKDKDKDNKKNKGDKSPDFSNESFFDDETFYNLPTKQCKKIANRINQKQFELSKSFTQYQKNQFPELVKNDSIKKYLKGADTVRLLIEQDDFSFEKIKKALKWGLRDDFWNDKILSLAAIRKKSKNGNEKFVNLYKMYMNKHKDSVTEKNAKLLKKHLEE